MKPEKYLPIGTVVLLKDAEKRLMITGFLPVDTENGKNKKYDYCGCPYPEGVYTMEEILLFNHNDICKVFCFGYSDEEEIEFKERLEEALKTINKKRTTE
jgi:hypothetical protein